jgi:hypothetical protein
MKTKRAIILVITGILMLGITFIIGCTGEEGTETPATSHFEASGISFDYPSNWKVLQSDDPIRLAYLSEVDTYTTLQVIKESPPGFTLKTYHDNLVIALMVGEPISGIPVNVGGLSGYETIFNAKVDNIDYRVRLICLEKDGAFYSIFGFTSPAHFDEVNKGFDTIINSFEIQ